MKKILIAVFAVLALAAWVVPAMAVDTTFYGTYRVRLFNTNNASDYSDEQKLKTYTGVGSATTDGTGLTTDSNSWIDQRFRLGVDSKASDKLRGFVQLEMGDTTGQNRSHAFDGAIAAANSTDQRIYVRQAYISFNAGPVRVKAGRSVFGDTLDGGQSFRVSDDNQYYGIMDGGLIIVSQVDGFFLTTQKNLDPLNLIFGYVKLNEGNANSGARTISSSKDDTLYIIQAAHTPSDTMKVGAYFLYESDTDETTGGARKPWWFGASLDAKFDPITLKIHAAKLGGKHDEGCAPGSCGIASTGGAADLKFSAYAIDADVSSMVGPAKVGFAAGIGSGDKSTEDTKSQGFTGVAPSYGQQLGARPAIFFDAGEVSNGGAVLSTANSNGISNTTLTNVTFAEIYGSFKATDELTLNALAAGFWHTEEKRTTSTTNTNTWNSKLGTEVDLVAVYKLYKELALVAQAAWFMPGEGIRTSKNTAGNNAAGSIATDDKVSEYFARIQYDF